MPSVRKFILMIPPPSGMAIAKLPSKGGDETDQIDLALDSAVSLSPIMRGGAGAGGRRVSLLKKFTAVTGRPRVGGRGATKPVPVRRDGGTAKPKPSRTRKMKGAGMSTITESTFEMSPQKKTRERSERISKHFRLKISAC
jgi:hypothetical protein